MVSGALDRLHSEKDPCVKYDVNGKKWIYLHRNRTENEFGRFIMDLIISSVNKDMYSSNCMVCILYVFFDKIKKNKNFIKIS